MKSYKELRLEGVSPLIRMDTMDDSPLTKCFEMLVERLTVLEKNVDQVRTILSREQDHKRGYINTAMWGWKMQLFVHEPIDQRTWDVFERPAAYYIQTNVEDYQQMDKYIMQQALDGLYDNEFDPCCMQTLKRRLVQELRSYDDDDTFEESLKCRQVGIKSERVYVLDHLKDIMVNRWLKLRGKERWASVTLETEDLFTVWMVPSTKARTEIDMRGCCEAMCELFDFLGIEEKVSNAQVCGLRDFEARFLQRYDSAFRCYCYETGRRDEWKRAERQALKAEAQRWGDWLREANAHPLWRGCRNIIYHT